MVFICLHKLHSVGIRVVSLTMDGSSANCNMISHFGGNLDANNLKCSFAHPEDNEPVFLFLDACHMLKLVRNVLADKGVLVDHQGRSIKWSYIVELQSLQTQEGLCAGNRLHERHIQWQ